MKRNERREYYVANDIFLIPIFLIITMGLLFQLTGCAKSKKTLKKEMEVLESIIADTEEMATDIAQYSDAKESDFSGVITEEERDSIKKNLEKANDEVINALTLLSSNEQEPFRFFKSSMAKLTEHLDNLSNLLENKAKSNALRTERNNCRALHSAMLQTIHYHYKIPEIGSSPKFDTPFGYFVEVQNTNRQEVKIRVFEYMVELFLQAANPQVEKKKPTTVKVRGDEKVITTRFYNFRKNETDISINDVWVVADGKRCKAIVMTQQPTREIFNIIGTEAGKPDPGNNYWLFIVPKDFLTLTFHYKDQALEINTKTAK